ncbi:uncharacterized protein GGS22DRAFT_195980 [Annulohypoxylon maeteangense]|uniref:uncharacterized protein n=1 Tax=Annulohypoxylon maeteangense TaxID=1927788 RepID=UPI002008D659|nr:uncharacterized protein GGS22DRAFT_195980 [Annulohypoxylon maeteangense]KAI0882247.1 hypothetical protein GGS22DRAFT_195980 [Annulohypoxylon maeteangense]
MARSKEEEAKGEALPAYSEFPDPSSLPTQPETSASASTSAPTPASAPTNAPTLASPFNFPSDSDLPTYTATAETILHKPLAIPQTTPDPKSPFLNTYSPLLLRHGVTPETWSSFLLTLSGFLAATVSDKAVSHAAQMARHVGQVPKRFGKETLAHAKSTGRAIADSARKGNYIGAATHTIIGGGVWLPVATAVRAVGAAVSLPFAVLGATVEDPKTPRERAEAYACAANAKWLHRRGLEAHLLETTELAPVLGLGVEEMLGLARGAKDRGAKAQLAALGAYVADVEVKGEVGLELGAITFWLVVTQKPEDEEGERGKGKGKGKKSSR